MIQQLKSLFIALVLLGLTACTSKPLLQPQVQLPTAREYSQVQLQQAIVSALEARHWQVDKIEPAQILASINVRQRHRANIGIDYNPSGFHIRYRDSQGLDYKDGKIHRNYNRWINSLRAEILHQLNLPDTL